MVDGFYTLTPDNVNDLAIDDVVGLIKDSDGAKGLPSPRVRLNYVKMLYDVLGLQLTPDAALASVAEPTSLMALSIAGGGKTTWSQTKAILQKLIRPARKPSKSNPKQKISGDKILCLVYNRHNVQDMKDRHKKLVNRMRLANIKGLDIDDDINASTLHAFCDFWRREFVLKFDLLGFRLMEDSEAISVMERAIKIAYKVLKKERYEDVSAEKCIALYTLMIERMCSIEDLKDNDKYHELSLEDEVLSLIFDKYELAKRTKRVYDFTDVLSKFNHILETDPEAKQHVQQYYEYVIADEVQDFTPLMWSILHHLVDNGTPLTVIGDEDQNIYRFRGADLYDILHFDKIFDDAQVYMLAQNRRCRDEILKTARGVIEENTLRFHKQLLGCKDGGNVKYVPYNTQEGQLISVINDVKKLSLDEQRDTVICYRNKEDSLLLADMLEMEEVPFHVISGSLPFSHELYRHIFSIFDALEQPYDRHLAINLYKVLPCSRAALASVFGYDVQTRKFTDSDDKHIHFAAYYYNQIGKINGFADVMDVLIELSNDFEKLSTKQIFNRIWPLFDKYFWKYKKDQNNNLEIDEIFEDRVKKFFDSDLSYPKFFEKYNKRLNIARRNTSTRNGIAVSTFHSLKGLEFSRVYAIYMDNNVFPNFSLIDSRDYSEPTKIELKEAETRLWYVAVTRAKDNLIIYYNKENPSYYVQKALNLSTESDQSSSSAFDLSKHVISDEDAKFNYLMQSAGLVCEYSTEVPVDSAADDFADGFADDFVDDFAEPMVTTQSDNGCTVVSEGDKVDNNGDAGDDAKDRNSPTDLNDLSAVSSTVSSARSVMISSLIARLSKQGGR